jgi:hypothetical protein
LVATAGFLTCFPSNRRENDSSSQFLAREIAHARPLNRHLAGMKANLALGAAPAVSSPFLAADVASPSALLASRYFALMVPRRVLLDGFVRRPLHSNFCRQG